MAAWSADAWIRHWCGGIFNDDFIANLVISVLAKVMKECLKSVSNFGIVTGQTDLLDALGMSTANTQL